MIMDEFSYDEDVFDQINRDLKLTKDKFYGILRCSRCYPKYLHWDSSKLTDHINMKTHVIRVVDVEKLVKALPDFYPNRLYAVHFECDTRCFDDRELHIPFLHHVEKILGEVSSNMDKLWKSNTNLLFVLSHPMYKKSLDYRFFKWLYQHSPDHCYRLYGVHKPK